MDSIFLFFKYYTVIFLLLLFGYYLIPSWLWYYLFFIKNREKWKHMRIQKKFPSVKQIRREIKYSILSVAIFSFISVCLYYCIISGHTKMYFQISDHGTLYFIVSPIIIILVHDALFYWSHRFMHIKKIFKYFHLVHHKSTNPSPFSIYAFQPGEALIEYSIYPIIFFLVPVHPFALTLFMLYNVFVNLAGHGGFEFMPEGFRKHRILKWQNSVTNHDMHHTNVKCNYGFYFTFWDEMMNTLADPNTAHNEVKEKTSAFEKDLDAR